MGQGCKGLPPGRAGAAAAKDPKGLNRLFDSPAILAIAGIFRFVVGDIDTDALKAMREKARLLPDRAVWTNALGVLESKPRLRCLSAPRRLQHPAPLPGIPRGARHARGQPARVTQRAANSSCFVGPAPPEAMR